MLWYKEFLIEVMHVGITFYDDKKGYLQKNNSKEKSIDIKNPEINNAVIDPIIYHQDLFINFTKSVLIQYPGAKTADLRRNCFEDMKGLNSRDSKNINDLLIKAGAKRSGRGEHANVIEWECKYPKAQWERVFNKKK